jgi:putative ABC transport system ATP-binding protein
MLEARDLRRHYARGEHVVRALDGVDLDVRRGEVLALLGASGSGKSTLLNLLAGMDAPTGGAVLVEGADLAGLSRREIARYRAHRVGMVFQSFHLVPHLTALQNVELAMCFGPVVPDRAARAGAELSRLGLADRLEHRPADLSGGEQQRVSLARALVRGPELVLADEPTGNLDAGNAAFVAGLLVSLAREGRAVVVSTHNRELAERMAARVLRLDFGRLVEEGA